MADSHKKKRLENSETNQNTKAEDRWVKVASNQYYDIYIDGKSIKYGGEAQNRYVDATLKFVYTPIGSAWLGNNSRGLVKPNIITHSFARFHYRVDNYTLTGAIPVNYYDVHNNLIVKDKLLANINLLVDGYPYSIYQLEYVPDSTQEKIKDRLFRAVGWNY